MISSINYKIVSQLQQSSEYINEKSDALAKISFVPAIQSSYKIVGKITEDFAGYVSTHWKEKIHEGWEDPFSTTFILRVSKPIERLSRHIASRTPIKPPLLRYLDVCLISSTQQLYTYLKEINYILSLPQHLKNYIAHPSFKRFVNKPVIILGKIWFVFSGPILVLKHLILKSLNIFLKVIDRLIDVFIIGKKFYLFQYLKDVVEESADKVHLKFVDIAHKSIDKRERLLRKMVIKEVANYSLQWVTSVATRIIIKTGIGILTYYSIKKFLEVSLRSRIYVLDAVVFSMVGKLLWDNTISPFLHSYYRTYNSNFDPEASGLKVFCKRYYIGRLYPPLKALKIYLQI